MRIIFALIAVFALLMTVGCGPDSELVASGKNHKCKLIDLAEKLKKDPTSIETAEEIKKTTGYLQAVIETAEEGDRAALSKAIDEAVAKGCD